MKTSKDVIEIFLAEAPKLIITINNDFGELNEEQLNQKPSPDKWSIGECIDHLIVSHNQYRNNIRTVMLKEFHTVKTSNRSNTALLENY